MNGMIFAAGLGTRLRPLTNDRPKALVELKGKTLLERVIERMREVQVERLVINIHHFADQVELFLKEKGDFGMDIVLSDERDGDRSRHDAGNARSVYRFPFRAVRL